MQVNQPLRDFPLVACHVLSRQGVNAQLFTQLADKRFWLGFSGLDFTACKFPHSRLVGVDRALRQ